jgi:hypothetical protein
MKRFNLILNHTRKITGNENIDGITDSEFVQHANDAQRKIQTIIVSNYNDLFLKEIYIGYESKKLKYELPDDIFANNRLKLVEWLSSSSSIDASSWLTSTPYVIGSVILGPDKVMYTCILAHTSSTSFYVSKKLRWIESSIHNNNYSRLERASINEKSKFVGWYTEDKNLCLTFDPDKSLNLGLRVSYPRIIKDIDIRRGTVSAISPNLIVNIATVPSGTVFDVDYISIVDFDGNTVQNNIQVTGYNAGTGAISTTTTIDTTCNGKYVVYGKDTTTHSELPDICEPYLIEYMALRTSTSDSSSDSQMIAGIFAPLATDLEKIFSVQDESSRYTPIIDSDYLYL